MEYFQYTFQALGAVLIIYGTLSGWISGRKTLHRSFWTRLDNAKAEREVHEFAMYRSSIAMQILVAIAIIVSATAMFYGVFFSNVLLALLDSLATPTKLNIAVSATQEILYLVSIAIVGSLVVNSDAVKLQFETLRGFNTQLFFFVGISTLLYAMVKCFTQVVPSLIDLADVIRPVFSVPVEDYFKQVFEPFALSVLVMSIPVCVFAGLVFLVLEFLDEHVPKQIMAHDFSDTSDDLINIIFVFSVGFIGSFFYTLMSGAIGTTFGISEGEAVTFQLVIWNSIFDGATLYATVFLLKWASASWRCRVIFDDIDRNFRKVLKERYGDFSLDMNEEELKSQCAKLLKSKPAIYSKALSNLKSNLDTLTSIFGCSSIVAMDRALYRTVCEKDKEINLLGYGRMTEDSISFDGDRSWIVHILSQLTDDMKLHSNKRESDPSLKHPLTYTIASPSPPPR